MIPSTKVRARERQKGAALLAVLWLSAALAAIAFSVASSVRGETERVATSEEDVRAYYIASGAIERAVLYMKWGQASARPDGSNPYYRPGQPKIVLPFPDAEAIVDVIPEESKINVNSAPPGLLTRLMSALGATEDRAQLIAAAIVDWRQASRTAEASSFDQYYLSLQPSFRGRHASIEDVEELLSVQGMTPDLFYGTWVRQGGEGGSRLVPRGGVRDCVSPYGGQGRYDVNTVQPAVLLAAGVAADDVSALVYRRNAQPVTQQQEMAAWAQSSPELANHLSFGPHNAYTLRATVRMRRPDGSLSDMRRTVAALVRFLKARNDKGYEILRWYDRG
jgi:general secretion pathway protein K